MQAISNLANMTIGKIIKEVVIIGSGPAGHTAAIYAARAQLDPVMYEGFLAGGVAAGGQLTTTTEVENFPGFPNGSTGTELMDDMRKQSEKFGTKIISETITRIDLSQRPFKMWLEGKDEKEEDAILSKTVILATGATAQRMHIPGEEEYWQAGISACAVCDGAVPIFRNKPLCVVGGGDSASEEATFLTKYGSKVYVLVRRDKLRASKIMADRLINHPKCEILWNKVPVEAKGDGIPHIKLMYNIGKLLNALTIKDTITGELSELAVNGLFYAIGHKPNTVFLKESGLDLDEAGYVKTYPNAGVPSTYTNIPGVFACGDVQDKTYRQAVTAAGTGCMSALDAERWLEANP